MNPSLSYKITYLRRMYNTALEKTYIFHLHPWAVGIKTHEHTTPLISELLNISP